MHFRRGKSISSGFASRRTVCRLDVRRWESLRQSFVKGAVRREIFLWPWPAQSVGRHRYNDKTGQYIPEAL